MSLRLCLSLLPLLIAGCASEVLVVPDSDWQTVPAAQRDAVDRQLAADLAAAHAEITAATASLAEAKRSQSTPAPAPRAPAASKPAGNGEAGITTSHAHEQAAISAKAKVEAAKAAQQHADLTWRQLRLDAANARLATIGYQRELARAQAVDHNLPGTDRYDTAPLRGQFSHAQQHWHNLVNAALQARLAFEQACATLASAKETYAQLMRGDSTPSSTQPPAASAERPALHPLPGWEITRSDIRRRRGLRHFLDDGGAPQLHGVAIQLAAWRVVLAVPTNATTSAPQGNAPTAPNTASKPADHPGSPASPAPGPPTNGKPPAEAPRGNPPTAVAKPADRPTAPASSTAAISINGKPPTEAPRSNTPTAASKPADHPASPAPPAAGTSVNGKPPAGPPPGNAPAAAKPADHPASPAPPATNASVDNRPPV